MKMNLEKTKIMFNQYTTPSPITIENEELVQVNDYIYLGHRITMRTDIMEEIKNRINKGWRTFGQLKDIFKADLPTCLKSRVFNQCVLPSLTYACETWPKTEEIKNKLRTTQRAMELQILHITKRDKKRNSWIRERTKVADIIERVARRKWKWAGHLARTKDKRWTLEILQWIPRDRKRPKGRPKRRWKDDLVAQLGENWPQRSQDRSLWRNTEEAFILQWIDKG